MDGPYQCPRLSTFRTFLETPKACPKAGKVDWMGRNGDDRSIYHVHKLLISRQSLCIEPKPVSYIDALDT